MFQLRALNRDMQRPVAVHKLQNGNAAFDDIDHRAAKPELKPAQRRRGLAPIDPRSKTSCGYGMPGNRLQSSSKSIMICDMSLPDHPEIKAGGQPITIDYGYVPAAQPVEDARLLDSSQASHRGQLSGYVALPEV